MGEGSAPRSWQAMFYPFGPKRDLIDAPRRITDMNPAAPDQPAVNPRRSHA